MTSDGSTISVPGLGAATRAGNNLCRISIRARQTVLSWAQAGETKNPVRCESSASLASPCVDHNDVGAPRPRHYVTVCGELSTDEEPGQ